MSQESRESAAWEACPAGTIQTLGERLRGRRRARRVQRWTITGMGLAGIAFVSLLWSIESLQSPANASLICTDVKLLAEAYVDGTLSDALADGVARHLDSCAHCRQMVKDLKKAAEGEAKTGQHSSRLHRWLDKPELASL